jgi:glycosyltransferase involved in cell wall biosynthesis
LIRDHTVSVVIPCYNEAEGLRRVIPLLPPEVDEVVVVDNNCTDDSARVARDLGARVVPQPVQGYGAAYKAGLPAATKDIVITMDADGTYPADQIVEVVEFLLDSRADFVSGSRFPLQQRGSMGFTNWLGNTVLTLVMFLLYFRRIRDSQSGMWIFRREILPRLHLTSDGMPLSEEIKIEAITDPEIEFREYHIRYYERVGEVKLEKWRDGLRNILFLVKKRFSRSARGGRRKELGS